MPIYDLKCPSCNKKWESFSSIGKKDQIPCPFCKQVFGITQITYCASPEIYGFYDKELKSYIPTKKQHSLIKKSKNLEEISPYETISTTHPYEKENEIKLKQANSYINWFNS